MKSICGLDIGTSKIRAVIAENSNGKPKIKSFLKENSTGLRRGTIVDLSETSKSLTKVLSEAKKIDASAISNIYVNIGTVETRTRQTVSSINISGEDNEITKEDVDRIFVLAKNSVSLEKNRTIIHSILIDYIIDGVNGILDPIGITGNKLEASYLIIDAFEPYIKNITKSVGLARGRVSGLIFNPISSARSILSKIQKELGVVLVDLGFNTTSIAVYEEGKLIHTKIFPIGSANISSDIAIGLKIPYELAEEIKIKKGYAFSKDIGAKEYVEADEFENKFKNKISKKFLAEIIEARLSEIFGLINKEIKLQDENIELAGGAVICGGRAKMPGLVDLAKDELKIPVQIGVPLVEDFELDNDDNEYFNDPENANVLGLVLLAKEYEKWEEKKKSSFKKIGNFFGYFKP